MIAVEEIDGLIADQMFKNGDIPVSHIEIHRKDVKTRRLNMPLKINRPSTPRGEIKVFSQRSRNNLSHYCSNCSVVFASMLTLTYPGVFPADGIQVKKHLNAIRRFLERRKIRGVWFLEFQKRGAPHFHLLLDLPVADPVQTVARKNPRPGQSTHYRTNVAQSVELSQAWFRIVRSGDQKHLQAGAVFEALENSEAAARYAAKHAAKPNQKIIPDGFHNVGRLWGRIGKNALPDPLVVACSTEEILQVVRGNSISSRGRIKKFLWGEADRFRKIIASDNMQY